MKINKKLKKYIEENVLPKYNNNDKAHGIEHINYVIERSMNFAKGINDINIDMVYAIDSYHDIAHHINPKKHEEISAKLFLKDKKLNEFFTQEEINIIYEAIIDHRASLEYEPRSIYGKIVSSADRNIKIEDILKRTYEYRIKNYKDISDEEIINESYEHIKNKFANNGYATKKMYFKDESYDKFLNDVNNLINDRKMFIELYKKINNMK